MRLNNIMFDIHMSKPELVVLMRQNKPQPRYQVDEIAQQHGHTVLMLPPYHPELHAIERAFQLISADLLERPAQSMSDLQTRIAAMCMQRITPEFWSKAFLDTQAVEERFLSTIEHELLADSDYDLDDDEPSGSW